VRSGVFITKKSPPIYDVGGYKALYVVFVPCVRRFILLVCFLLTCYRLGVLVLVDCWGLLLSGDLHLSVPHK
jgi:hypothetical protein